MREKLRERRIKEKFTQKKIAEQVGISERAYRLIEVDQVNPKLKTVQALSIVLKCTIEDIFPSPQLQLRGNTKEPESNQAEKRN